MLQLSNNGPSWQEFYNCKYDPKNPEFWKNIELPNGADEIYVSLRSEWVLYSFDGRMFSLLRCLLFQLLAQFFPSLYGLGLVTELHPAVRQCCHFAEVCIGVKASNYFMPAETLSDKGPGGGGWIHFNKHLQAKHVFIFSPVWFGFAFCLHSLCLAQASRRPCFLLWSNKKLQVECGINILLNILYN